MANDTTLPGGLVVQGAISAQSITAPTARTNINTEFLQPFPVELQLFRVWDAFQTPLGSASSDDLGMATGTFATGLPYITTSDAKNTSVTQRARVLFKVPKNYDAAANAIMQINLRCGMLTTVASSSATIDVEAYLSNRDTAKSGSDLISTSLTSINSLTFADVPFNFTTTTLVAGSWLDIRVTIAITDVATGTAVIGAIAHAEMLMAVKG